jgi:hypothetical protein
MGLGETSMAHHSYIVRSAADTTAPHTLRSAILYANAHPGTTITFAATLDHHTITLKHELPLILGDHTVIDGSGARHLTISGARQISRVLRRRHDAQSLGDDREPHDKPCCGQGR